MLLKGLNHVAVLTHDATRLNDFYREVFDAEILHDGSDSPRARARASPSSRSVTRPSSTCSRLRGTPRPTTNAIFGRGRLDHLALQAASVDAFETIRERLMARGAADDFVTDFGPMLSVFFRDPTASSPRSASRIPMQSPGPTTRRGPGLPATPERDPTFAAPGAPAWGPAHPVTWGTWFGSSTWNTHTFCGAAKEANDRCTTRAMHRDRDGGVVPAAGASRRGRRGDSPAAESTANIVPPRGTAGRAGVAEPNPFCPAGLATIDSDRRPGVSPMTCRRTSRR